MNFTLENPSTVWPMSLKPAHGETEGGGIFDSRPRFKKQNPDRQPQANSHSIKGTGEQNSERLSRRGGYTWSGETQPLRSCCCARCTLRAKARIPGKQLCSDLDNSGPGDFKAVPRDREQGSQGNWVPGHTANTCPGRRRKLTPDNERHV